MDVPPKKTGESPELANTEGLEQPDHPTEVALDHLVGQRVSRYVIVDKLGVGGMGVVYRAEDPQLERTVALKFLPPALSGNIEAITRFVSEAKAASALDHPNICTIYEVDTTDSGYPFIAMAFYDGETLHHKIARAPLSANEALDYASQIARGLERAHERGIIHRDIKPANVIITPDKIAKILDFGLAKMVDLNVTQPGAVLGTYRYMSPEQARGESVDGRTDIWSLGVVLYEMLTGERLFHAESGHAVLYQVVHEPLAGRISGSFPPHLLPLLERCLEKEPARRYGSMSELLNDLQGLVQPSVSASRWNRSWSASSPSQVKLVESSDITIVVLPFLDMSPEKDQEYFSDGMAEELSDSLAKIDRWRVVARTSAFSFKGKDLDARQIGRQLGASHFLLEGSIRKAGDRLRIRVEFVDVQTGLLLWSEKYRCELNDFFEIEEEIAQSVVANLKVKLEPTQEKQLVKRHTDDLEAYNAYLKARYHLNKRTESGFHKCREYCERALEHDPQYAPAHACLADCLLLLGFHGAAPPGEIMPSAKAAAERALELDDGLAEAHNTLGCVRSVFDWDWSGAERAFARALLLNRNCATAHHWWAVWCLLPTGQFDKAMKALETALTLDPVSLILNAVMGWRHYFARQFEDAVEALEHTLEIDDGFVVAHDLLGQVYLQQGRLDEAIRQLREAVRLSGGRTLSRSALGHAYAVADQHGEARQVLDELSQRGQSAYVSSYDIALIHAGLGELDAAFERLERAIQERSGWLVFLNVEPRLDPLREDPRFDQIRHRIGLP